MQINSSIKNLSEAITIHTVSNEDAPVEMSRFIEFHDFLMRTYPKFHDTTEQFHGLEYSLLYKWKGSGSVSKPFALIAHQDVVAIEKGTESDWTHPPFSGIIDGGAIWGRGATDDKCSLIGILEACEQLISEGFVPERDIFIGFSHNEETMAVGADSGAHSLAQIIKDLGVELEFVLDEGGAVITDSFMGLDRPIAAIGLAEKGYCDIKVTIKGEGGHSSEPPAETAVTSLARLITNLEKMSNKNVKPTKTLFDTLRTIGKNKGGLQGFVLSHPKLFFPLIKGQLLAEGTTSAMLRTTYATTIISAGIQPNVIPQNAEAIINSRIIAGEGKQEIESLIKEAFYKGTKRKQDISYSLEYLSYSPSMPETSSDTKTFGLLSELTEEIHGAIPLPYTMIGSSDSKEYVDVTSEIYRFFPFALTFDDMGRMHGTNERILCQSFLDGIEFYKRFIEKASVGRKNVE